ncbi:MAG: hypothetical protein IJL06_00030, partial [Kiritimatiellae bacterium]|nr:hypothetical protein [Kiritimatiellia bacterium]
MKRTLSTFCCGAVAGAVAASAVWSLSRDPAPAPPAPDPASSIAETVPPPVGEAVSGIPLPERTAADTPAPGRTPAPEDGSSGEEPSAPSPPPDGTVGGERRGRRGPPRWEEMSDGQREEIRQRFRRMADERAQRMADTFVERNGLAEADAETILAIADGMNELAMERIQRWTDYLQLQGADAIPKDQGARVMRDLFADLVDGYAELDEAFGAGWRENDPDFDLGQMLSPEVWGSLFRLGGGFGGPGGGPRGPRGPRGPGGPG